MLSPQRKIKAILALVAGMIILAVLSPFIFSSGQGFLSAEFVQGTFLVLDFLFIAYLWKKFNNIRRLMDKKEPEDEKISELEMSVQKATHKKL